MSELNTTITRTLNMTFGNEDGNRSIGLEEPLDELTSETVADTMMEIGALGTLVDAKGKVLTEAIGAELQTVTKQRLF